MDRVKIIIDSNSELIPHRKHWQFCVGSGHALLALRTDYVRQLKFIHDELGIERVRFHGIFCDDMRTYNDLSMQMNLPGAEAFEEYNFNACGVAYDNVLEAGMKPFVELSFMPRRLAVREEGRTQEGSFFYKPLIVPPADLEKWKTYIRAFVRYLIHRYGLEEIRSWFFEVWNEPDLPVAFWNGTRDEYFALYGATVEAVKSVDAQIPVGGPATSNSKWIASFLRYCEANHLPVDFVTTHQYAGDPLGGVTSQGDPHEDGITELYDPEIMMNQMISALRAASSREKTFLNGFRAIMPDKSETTDLPDDLFLKNVQIVRKQAGKLPLYYTEWNENAIFSAFTNDTRKVAAYDVKAALNVADYLDGSSIWCFSDIFEELHPFPQEFHGGFGMLTQSGIPKPVFHAMKMLADAGDQRLDLGPDATKGEIGCAAFRKGDAIQILLFRQKMKNLALPPAHAEIIVETPSAPASVSVRKIDETHGNPLRVWQEMGCPVSLNRAEVNKIVRASEVTEEQIPFIYEDGSVKIDASLGVNDVWMLTLS